MKNSEQINGKHRAGLSEQHELGELPADDEQGGGARHGQHVLPAWPVQEIVCIKYYHSLFSKPYLVFLVVMLTARI